MTTQTAAEAAYAAARAVLPEQAILITVVVDENGNPSLDFDFGPEFSIEDVARTLREAADQL